MTISERYRAAAIAENIRSKVTRNHLDGMVRWKARPSHIGPYLLRVIQTGDSTWSAFAVEHVEYEGGHFCQQTGPEVATAGSTDDAIRAGLVALAEREEAKS